MAHQRCREYTPRACVDPCNKSAHSGGCTGPPARHRVARARQRPSSRNHCKDSRGRRLLGYCEKSGPRCVGRAASLDAPPVPARAVLRTATASGERSSRRLVRYGDRPVSSMIEASGRTCRGDLEALGSCAGGPCRAVPNAVDAGVQPRRDATADSGNRSHGRPVRYAVAGGTATSCSRASSRRGWWPRRTSPRPPLRWSVALETTRPRTSRCSTLAVGQHAAQGR